jgi:hypothetical protein
VAQVNLTVDGRPLRVQSAAATVDEAVRLATERFNELDSALNHRSGHRAG